MGSLRLRKWPYILCLSLHHHLQYLTTLNLLVHITVNFKNMQHWLLYFAVSCTLIHIEQYSGLISNKFHGWDLIRAGPINWEHWNVDFSTVNISRSACIQKQLSGICIKIVCHESTLWCGSTGNTTVTSWKGLGVACDLSGAITLERKVRWWASVSGTVEAL